MSNYQRNEKEPKHNSQSNNRIQGHKNESPDLAKDTDDEYLQNNINQGQSVEEHAALLMNSESEAYRDKHLLSLQRSLGNAYVQRVIIHIQCQRGLRSKKNIDITPIPGSNSEPVTQRQFNPDAGDILTWALGGLAAIADEVQKRKALAAAEQKVPEIQSLLRENPGQGVLIVYIMKQPDRTLL